MLLQSYLHFLRRRPRCKILADTISGDFELFFLVAFFFLHDGEDNIYIQPAILGELTHLDSLGMGGCILRRRTAAGAVTNGRRAV